MRRLLALFTIILFSQMAKAQKNSDPYEVLWEQVEKLENESLIKSALQVVETISAKAKAENNAPQTVKTLLFASKYTLTLEEDAQLKIIKNFRLGIAQAESPTKNVLQSYLANLYWQYFQQNRYRFYNRTSTEVKIDSTDFRTWDLTMLFKEISKQFEASLTDGKVLKETAVSEFEAILNKQEDAGEYRPTLFDLLAQNALSFYSTSENNIGRPADKFEIDDPEIFCAARNFLNLKIDTEDNSSLQVKALRIYQQLLALHLQTGTSYSLVEVDIQRLHFIYKNAVFPDKEEHFLEVLRNSVIAVKDNSTSTLYQYEIATLLYQQGADYRPGMNEEVRWKIKEALALCESVIKQAPNSRGAEKCSILKSEILQKTLQLTIERHIPVNTASRLLVNYKNHGQLLLSARNVTQEQWDELRKLHIQEKKLAYIKKLAVVASWEATLKNEKDYQAHSTEIIMPPLKNGRYLILAEPKVDVGKTFAYSALQVTDLALIDTQTDATQEFQVVDRNNGKPIEGARLAFRYRLNNDRKYLSKSFVSDKTGAISIARGEQQWNSVSVTIDHKNDTAYFDDYRISKSYENSEPGTNYSCFLFTDRSIYRPGQALYFKGIALKSNKNISSILPDTKLTVELKDVNGQLIHTADFKTNQYGSFSGEFILPGNGLTGQFSMRVNSSVHNINGYANFSVEEYKRPKFETNFEPITESYKVNDSIAVHGTAIAYAGSKISDAKVTYRVIRTVYYPRWYTWRYPSNNTIAQEIVHGETTTDALGKYTINFKALADKSVSKKNLPTFTFKVTADVTDINGETHSTNSYVTVGYHSMTAKMRLPDPLDKNIKDTKLTIVTNNLNGQFVPAKGTVKMYKLESPKNVLRPRPWAAPDYEGFTKEEFKKLFPHDAYLDEHDPSRWKKGELVLQTDFNTEKSKALELGSIKKWDSGKYIIELETKDKYGQEVKDVLETTLFSEDDQKLADNQLFQIKTDKNNYAIGDKAKITLLSNARDIVITVHIEKNQNLIDTKIIHLNGSSKSFTVPVDPIDLGGFTITYSYAVYNAFLTGTLNIQVPYPPTELQMETISFRDKLQPGSDETWSFKIKGPKGDKVAAELLANMYDASLDEFREHHWYFNPLIKPTYSSNRRINGYRCFTTSTFQTFQDNLRYSYTDLKFDSFNWFGFYFGQRRRYRGEATSRMMKMSGVPSATEASMDLMEEEIPISEALSGRAAGIALKEEENSVASSARSETLQGQDDELAQDPNEIQEATAKVQIRKNLQETAFFFPQLLTDKDGNVSFNFTAPEALTKWNVQLIAHTKKLESIYETLQTVTQKELMVIPNTPRFLREGDEIVISTKIANLSEKPLSGQAKLELINAVTGENISKLLLKDSKPSGELKEAFKVDSMDNTQVSWRLHIPEGVQAVRYIVTAKAGDFSDGEQNLLPVLTNRMLVTETLPMWVRSNQTKTFTLNKLASTPNSQHNTGVDGSQSTLKNHKLTLEITSNPAWYAVQALPYLMEYPYECNEQTFSKYYANSLATYIANKNPRIQEVFRQWADSDALLSNLEKNQELKSLLIQETPWLRDAQSETEQKKRIALLFNLDKMKNEQETALNKLGQNQKSSGAWPWFNGGPDNRFVTQHIIAGLGHLKQLTSATLDDRSGAEHSQSQINTQNQMIIKAIEYLDGQFVAEYIEMKKHASDMNNDHLSRTQIHYLYMRSFFKEIKTSKTVDEITSYYKGQAQRYWISKSLYSKGLLALIMHRFTDAKTSEKILRSLEENSITSEELGMYWKENTNSWYWHQAPIETQSLLIEAFSEIYPKDIATVDNLKIWLLKNKQTSQWKTTKATTEAVYALLLQSSDWLSVTNAVSVLIGGKELDPSRSEQVKVEAGTGYFKSVWNGSEVNPAMGEVQISKRGEGIAWGALSWQYFEDLNKISSANTPLKVHKKLFLKKNTDTGEEISEITAETELNVGDLVRVRIELRADRDMEFVHMKDMRAAGFEPINVISKYKWQDGLGYFESTRDASTNFFFDLLRKGVYVFEYDLRVNNAGDFSNGITFVQSMYAPEFSSHSEGIRVNVK